MRQVIYFEGYLVSRGLLRPPVGCICLARDAGPFCYFTDSESAAALAASHAAPAL